RRHTRFSRDWSSDVCSSDLLLQPIFISSMMANDAFLREWAVNGEQQVDQMQRYLAEILREYGTVTSFFVSEKTRNYYFWDGILKIGRASCRERVQDTGLPQQ